MIGFDWSEWAVLRFVGASFILWLCYYLLFERKASFNQCRRYLVYSVLLAMTVSVIRIPIYPVEIEIQPLVVEQSATLQKVKPHITSSDIATKVEIAPEQPTPMSPNENEVIVPYTQEKEPFYKSLNYWQMAWYLYGLGVLVLLLRLSIEMIRLWRLKRWGSCTVDSDGINIVRNNQVTSPFSFYRTVFINRKIEGEVLRVVMLHEKAHIRNHHYRDTVFIECLCILCWFNPFVWLIKRELRALHEFQVDRSMLSGEIELSNYQSILFEELMGYSPNIANGFHNSLIKKRFIMMKLQYKERFGRLRKVALFSLLIGMPALFSFTDRPVYTEAPSAPKEVSEAMLIKAPAKVSSPKEVEINKLPVDTETKVTPETKKVSEPIPSLKNKDTLANQKTVSFTVPETKSEIDLTKDQTVESRAPRAKHAYVRFVERTNNDTRVTISVPVYYDRHWIQFEKGLSIVDEATKDIYRIRSITRDIKLNKTYWITGMNNRSVEFTLVFPPLDKKVKVISIRDCFPEENALTPPNGAGWRLDNININELAPTVARLEEYDREGRPLRPDRLGEVTLRSDQVQISPYSSRGGTRIVRIDNSQNDNTLVILNVPISYDRHWLKVGKGLCIVDRKTGTVYRIKGVAHDIEMNKLLWVEGCQGRSILLTLIFPKLKDKVKTIDFYSKYPDANTISPSNGSSWDWRNIKIKDYEQNESRRIIL